MVRLNVFVEIRDSESKPAVINVAKELADKSINDKGCVDYDVYASLNEDNHLMIVETWENRKDLEKHQHTEHFKKLLPQLEEVATVTLEIFDF